MDDLRHPGPSLMAKSTVRFNSGKTEQRVKGVVARNMKAAALLVQADATQSLSRGGRSGRVYKRGNVQHKASAPGEPPATDTGRLQGSMGSDVLVLAKQVVGFIFAQVNYAVFLETELGLPRVAPRPFLRPAILNNTKKILRILSRK